jgi:hypothetical protein
MERNAWEVPLLVSNVGADCVALRAADGKGAVTIPAIAISP